MESSRRNAITNAISDTSPGVASINVTQIQRYSVNPWYEQFQRDPLFSQLFPSELNLREVKSSGSGVVISPDGYIITNDHVVENASKIIVTLPGGNEYEAEVIGVDQLTDLALLKLDGDNFPYVKVGDSDKLIIGEWVVALGNPFGLFDVNQQPTATVGIISGKNMDFGQQGSHVFQDMIQTDAAINPGNSGGALLNMKGELIGINTAIATGGYEKSNRGVGFAIPSNMTERIMSDLIDKGYVTRSWLGVYIQPLDADAAKALEMNSRDGALVTQVVGESPAELGGVQEGDVIIRFDNKNITDPSNLRNIVSLMPPGSKSDVVVFRNGSKKNLSVVLQELKDGKQVAVKSNSSNESVLGLELKEINGDLMEKYNIDEDDGKIVVVSVDVNSEADDKGLVEGDVIKRVGTQQVNSLKEFKKKEKASRKRGSLLLLVKKNDGSSRFVTLNY